MSTTALCAVRTFTCAEYLRRLGHLIDGSTEIPVRRHPTIREIQEAVAKHFRTPLIEMWSARRCREVARPRQVSMYLCRCLTPRSMPEIGRHHGHRDHTTVLHAIRQVKKLRSKDREFDDAVATIRRQLEENSHA